MGKCLRGASMCLILVVAVGCTKKSEPAPPAAPATADGAAKPVQSELIERGKKAYLANCTACHNSDPSKDGAVGPALAGSELDLIEARVMRAAYPQGYYPKRSTTVMVALPHLKDEIPALHAYLSSLQ